MPFPVPGCASRWTTLGLIALGLVATPSTGRTQDVLDIPSSCGSQEELNREVSALAKEQVHRDRPRVHLWEDSGRYRLEVALTDGTRGLVDDDCRSLFRAATVIVALAQHGAQESPESSASNAPVPAEQALQPEQAVRPEQALSAPTPTGRPAREVEVFLASAASYGLVPKLGVALSVGVAARHRWLGYRVFASYLTPRSMRDGPEGVRVTGVSASATLELLLGAWVRPGIGGDYVLLHGQGRGVSRARSDWAALASLHAGVTLRVFQRARFSLSVLGRGLYTPRPARFVMRGRGAVFTTSSFGFQTGLAAAWQFH